MTTWPQIRATGVILPVGSIGDVVFQVYKFIAIWHAPNSEKIKKKPKTIFQIILGFFLWGRTVCIYVMNMTLSRHRTSIRSFFFPAPFRLWEKEPGITHYGPKQQSEDGKWFAESGSPSRQSCSFPSSSPSANFPDTRRAGHDSFGRRRSRGNQMRSRTKNNGGKGESSLLSLFMMAIKFGSGEGGNRRQWFPRTASDLCVQCRLYPGFIYITARSIVASV